MRKIVFSGGLATLYEALSVRLLVPDGKTIVCEFGEGVVRSCPPVRDVIVTSRYLFH